MLKSSYICFIFCACFTPVCLSKISVVDDRDNQITLESPAKRIVSLAPHITEILFAVGAGDKVVGTVRYSNYPQSAQTIPRIGDAYNLDIEYIISLQPDLIVSWYSGNTTNNLQHLHDFGYPIYTSEPRTLETIAKLINDLGSLAGMNEIAKYTSTTFLHDLQNLRNKFTHRAEVSIFYQIWHNPIYTINGDHIINEVIQLCGGNNIFAELPILSPQISLESVLKVNPAVIIASGTDMEYPSWLKVWQAWPKLDAVRNGHLYVIPPDLIQRHSPRILEGATMLCKYLDKAR